MSSAKNFTKRPSRQAELQRLAAKQGWYDGQAGKPATLPEKMVMRPGGGVGYNPVPKSEQAAYIKGHMAGSVAGPKDRNPYGAYNSPRA
jgi:hypothetical protein